MDRRTSDGVSDEFEMLFGENPITNTRSSSLRQSGSNNSLQGWEVLSADEVRVNSSMFRNQVEESYLTSAFNKLLLKDRMPRLPTPSNATFSLNDTCILDEYLCGQDSVKFLQLRESLKQSLDSLPGDYVGAQSQCSPLYGRWVRSNPHTSSNVEEMKNRVILENLQSLENQRQILIHSQMGRQGNGDFYNNNVCSRKYDNIGYLSKSARPNAYHSESLNWGKYHYQVGNEVDRQILPDNLLARYYAVNSRRKLNSECVQSHQKADFGRTSLYSDVSPGSSTDSCHFTPAMKSPELRFCSFDEVVGRIYDLAIDQNGCQILQKFIDEDSPDKNQKIFDETIHHVIDIITDPSGTCLFSKLFKVGTEDQRMQILQLITRRQGELFAISCNRHGSRFLQHVIAYLKTEEQPLVISSLKYNILGFMRDDNASHVVKCCLRYFLPEHTEFIFDVAIAYCIELATDCQGCCVLQKCLRYSNPNQRKMLMSQIASHTLFLTQDKYGNFAVQYALDKACPKTRTDMMNQLMGHYGDLSVQKSSSHVVEKCLEVAKEDECQKIIQELTNNPQLWEISQNQFGNYVLQCAYKESKGAVRDALVKAIKPHERDLQCSPYGRKVLRIMGLVRS